MDLSEKVVTSYHNMAYGPKGKTYIPILPLRWEFLVPMGMRDKGRKSSGLIVRVGSNKTGNWKVTV